MDVNFNNLRKKACYAYDKLVNKLNSAIEENDGEYLSIRCEEIQSEMDDLRMLIASIAMCYNEQGMDDVYDEIYTGEKDIKFFNIKE